MEDKTLTEILEEVKNNTQNPELVRDNKFYFDYEDRWYRVNMPNQKQLAEANLLRNKIRIQLAQKGKKEGFYFKEDLIKLLKDENIDINSMDEEVKILRKEYVQLAITVAKKKDNKIEDLEKRGKEIDDKIRDILNKKAEHLTPAIEYQAEDSWYKSLIANCTEKQIEEKWERVWKNFNEFQEDNSNLPYVAEAYLGSLIN